MAGIVVDQGEPLNPTANLLRQLIQVGDRGV